MLEKNQRAKCTGTPSMCTSTPEQKSGSEQSVPVHLRRKVTVTKVYRYTTNMYRYTCMKIMGIE